ncbi:MAG TPA: mechanosensitive ion channel domain-containing protein [Methylomirabilota bacterium]|nr:mechanosensitive ion channel domain-containing protein [Methylomirabilota bacterium]
MSDVFRLVGPNHAVELFGVTLVGVNAINGRKLLFTLLFIALILLVARVLRRASLWLVRGRGSERVVFWARQGINLTAAALLFIGLVSVWFDDPVRLATALGLITAGLAFALQKVVTAIAGYFVILRGQTFNVGDRIVMGGVRGDVIALGFTQTTIMEMGQPPPVQKDDPAMWVQSRQYTGRVVSVSNARIFDEPVYNYTREFPYLWEELAVPIPYTADWTRAERILLTAAETHGVPVAELSAEVLAELQRRYFLKPTDVRPRVYFRLTDNWLELTVRFVVRDHGIREQKDAVSREVLAGLDAAGIPIASATFDVVGLPPVRLADEAPRPARREAG